MSDDVLGILWIGLPDLTVFSGGMRPTDAFLHL